MTVSDSAASRSKPIFALLTGPAAPILAAGLAFLLYGYTAAPGLTCDTRLNIRWETFAIDHVSEVIGWLADRPGDIAS